MGWCLIADIDRDEAFAPVNRMTYLIFLILLIILFTITAIFQLLSKKISNPIIKLHHGTEEIMKGNLDFKVGTSAPDEIGQLSRDFDKMTASLKKSMGEIKTHSKNLEKIVEKRTKKLSEVNQALEKDIIKRKKLEEKLKKLAHFDTLTGCLTRGYGLALLEQQIKIANRKKTPILLLYLDVDNFKDINDTYGHAEGDMVLKEVATLFKSTLREVDIVCRIGGDEFLLIFPDSSLKDTSLIKERINKRLKKLNENLNKPYKISFSIGFSVYDPANPVSIEKLIKIADAGMYKEKKEKNTGKL